MRRIQVCDFGAKSSDPILGSFIQSTEQISPVVFDLNAHLDQFHIFARMRSLFRGCLINV